MFTMQRVTSSRRISVLLLTLLQLTTFISAFDSSEMLLEEEEQNKKHSPLTNYFNEHFLRKSESAKRSSYATSPIIRFGKRNSFTEGSLRRELRTQQHMMDPLIRFGKRSGGFQCVDTPLIRFGKREPKTLATFSSTPHIRFGKRAMSSLAFSSTPHIRFGKRADNDVLFANLADSSQPISGYYASEPDNIGFIRYRRPNPVGEEDTMLRFG